MSLSDYNVYPQVDSLMADLRQYDLFEHVAELAAYGMTVVPTEKMQSKPGFVERLRDAIIRVCEERNGVKIGDYRTAKADRGFGGNNWHLLEEDEVFVEAAINPVVLTLVRWLLGQSAVFSGQTWILKGEGAKRGGLHSDSHGIPPGAGQETHPGLHSDYGASRIAEPFPDFCVLSVAVWAIDDFKAENGPTVIMPGSFRERRQVPAGTTQEGTTSIEMSQGSIAMWHGATWHGSTPRTAAGTRTSLHNAYCRNFVRPIEGYQDIDPEIIERNPPALSTLCGLDDPFGKSGDDGADFERLKYSAQAGYGQSTPLPAWNENR